VRKSSIGLLAVCALLFVALAVTAFLVESDEKGAPQIRVAGETTLGPVTYHRPVKRSTESESRHTGSGSTHSDTDENPEEEEEVPPEEEPPVPVPEEEESPPPDEPPEKPPEQR
jgi:outer membrane biosynthesis protein TonB